jgi:hypothetical protein
MTEKELLLDYLFDHAKHFAALPMDVELNDKVLSWSEYHSMLTAKDYQILDTLLN